MQRSILMLALCFLSTAGIVAAHGDETSYEATVGQYQVDIGYEPAVPEPGERMLLDFALLNSAGEQVTFDDVWVRIEQDTKTVLATAVAKPTLGPTTLVLLAPEGSGDLSISARFEKDGKALAETSFTLKPASRMSSTTPLVSGGIGFVFGVLLVALGRWLWGRQGTSKPVL